MAGQLPKFSPPCRMRNRVGHTWREPVAELDFKVGRTQHQSKMHLPWNVWSTVCMWATTEVVSKAITAAEAIASSCLDQFCDSLLAAVVRGGLQRDRGRFLPNFMT